MTMNEMTIKKVAIFLLAYTAVTVCLQAEEAADAAGTVYSLDEVRVVETVQPEMTGETITQDDMERDNAHDLWEAVRYTPGVILSGGGRRGDATFTLRGFGADSVPIFIDGIVMTSPFKANGDAARMLTGDLESVTIQKGYSSTMLGPNTLGGAVLMRTAKPKKKLEARLDATLELDSVYKEAAQYYLGSVGTKQDLYYVKGTVQYRDIDHFRLSRDFEPTAVNPQKPGDRLFSGSKDAKYTLIGGITPTDAWDIWATYIYQEADKGVSPPETTIQDYVIWDWTNWKRHTASLAASYDAGPLKMDGLVYYNKFDNALDEYWSLPSYKAGVHDPSSVYDEYTVGGRLSADWRMDDRHMLRAGGTVEHASHLGIEGDETQISVKEDTMSLGLEYTGLVLPKLTVVAGVGYDALEPREFWSESDEFAEMIGADAYVIRPKSQWLVTGQFGLFYEVADDHEVRLTYAHKNRFPTMSERYSTRYGRTLPNPYLQPEIADHYELGYKGRVGSVKVDTAVYYSILTDKIVMMSVPNPSYPTILVDYNINLDEVTFYGYELGLEAMLNDYTTGGMSFSLNEYDIGASVDRSVEVIDYYPEVTASGYLVIVPTEKLTFIPRVEYVGARYATTDRDDKLDAYWLANLKAVYDVNDHLSLSVKVDNIFDQYYELKQFYPQPGRTFSFTLSARY